MFRNNASETAHVVEKIQRAAQTSYDVFKILKSYIPKFRLNNFIIYMVKDHDAAAPSGQVVLTNWDSEVVHRCMVPEHRHRSFLRDLRSSVLPKSTLIGESLAGSSDMDDGDFVEFMRARGYEAFVHSPVRSSDGRNGGVSFSGDREKVALEEVMHLSFVAKHVFERLTQIIGDAGTRENPLSDREIECLKAAARGLSVFETSRQLGISSHTVNYHLANAQKKLGARNKLQTVVNAIEGGWLGRF